MAKTYLNHAKYIIKQDFEIKGVVDKHDIIGAIFGQSEGLIGEDLDIRELQSAGKIGRIELELSANNGVTTGTLIIPSGADMIETSVLAATIEVVDKVGPCDAKFTTAIIEDTRDSKRKQIISRAKELLAKIMQDSIPDSQEITNSIKEDVQISRVCEYGPDKHPAGPSIAESEEIILVEGRADVINLLKYNIKNAIAMGGSKMPQSIIDLCKKKTVTVFIDGDRGGELDLKKLLQIAEIDYIAKAPPGLEVEELAKKQIIAALNKRIPVAQTKKSTTEIEETPEKYWENKSDDLLSELDIEVREQGFKKEPSFTPKTSTEQHKVFTPSGFTQTFQPRQNTFVSRQNNEYKPRPVFTERPQFVEKSAPVFAEKPKVFEKPKELSIVFPMDVKKISSELKNTFNARFYDKDGKMINEKKVRDIIKDTKEQKGAEYLVFDGIITKRLVELAKNKGIKAIIGSKKGKMDKIKGIEVLEFDES